MGQLLVSVIKLKEMWSTFVVEDDLVLDHSIESGLLSKYSDTLRVEMLELIEFVKAVASRIHEYAPDQTLTSKHGGLRASLNTVVGTELR